MLNDSPGSGDIRKEKDMKIKVTNGEETMSIIEFLQWQLCGGKASYECNPVEPQPEWDELSDDEKIETMTNDLEHAFTDGGWQVIIGE